MRNAYRYKYTIHMNTEANVANWHQLYRTMRRNLRLFYHETPFCALSRLGKWEGEGGGKEKTQ